jgi:hypothetical protein
MANELGDINGNDIYGMAPSWLRTDTLVLDTYNNPNADNSGKCFIGFQYYSKPWNDNTDYYSYTYEIFGSMFYYFALNGYNVRNALNQASLYYLGMAFDSQNPRNDFYYGYNYQGYTCKIRIFGDSDMSLPN